MQVHNFNQLDYWVCFTHSFEFSSINFEISNLKFEKILVICSVEEKTGLKLCYRS